MKFREHRGSFAESMKTVVDVKDRAELLREVQRVLYPLPVVDFSIRPYGEGPDRRTGWNTYVVTVDGYGVAGFTDGPL